MSSAAVTPENNAEAASRGSRRWLAVAGMAGMVVCLVPPVATLARRYVYAESAQFVVFAMAAPALIVLGAPWRFLRLSRPGTGPAARPAGPVGLSVQSTAG